MTDEERDIELAEKYVMQRMNSDEAAAFERRMEADPELQNTVSAFQELMSSLKAADKDQLREMLRKQEENINTHKQNKKPFRKYLIRIAALLLILIGAASILYFTVFRNNSSNEKLALQYKPTEPGLPVLMDKSEPADINEAMNLFRAEEFSKAQSAFAALLKQAPTNDTLLYFISVCHFELNNFPQAESYLKRVVSDSNPVWKEKAEYWLSLALLAEDKKDESRTILLKIESDKTHLFSKKASELLREKYFR